MMDRSTVVETRGHPITLLLATLAVAVLGVAAWRGWPHLRFWWLFEPLGKNAQGYPEYRHRRTGIVMVRVPGGRFWMGGTDEEHTEVLQSIVGVARRDAERRLVDETPLHDVEVSAFLIAKFEVSRAEWKRVMASNPSAFKGADLPIEGVSWSEAQHFCQRTGLALPTEAQWEFACRARTTTPFSFGPTISHDIVNYRGSTPFGRPWGEPAPVASFGPNPFGLHQMHGNVEEWCRDVYDRRSYESAEAFRRDPESTAGSGCRVSRGGGWFSKAWECRSACRRCRLVDESFGVGIRPVHSIP